MKTYILKTFDFYKIGLTSNFEKRLKAYKTHNPSVDVVLVLEGDYEKQLHSLFKDKHSHLEFFNLTDLDVELIISKYETNELSDVSHRHDKSVKLFTNIDFSVSPSAFVLFRILIFYSDAKNYFSLNKNTRPELAVKTKLREKTVTNGVSELLRSGMVLRVDRGEYRVNPLYAWKGSLQTRKQALEQSIDTY